jgi:ATP-dependent RNA helicase RhlE
MAAALLSFAGRLRVACTNSTSWFSTRRIQQPKSPTAQTTRGVSSPRDSRRRHRRSASAGSRPPCAHAGLADIGAPVRIRKNDPLNAFLALGLAEPITRALADEGYAAPTPIQSQTIPQVLAARDVLGIAQTGTGKTAAFALPILHRLAETRRRPHPRTCRVLVLSPTRELSAQIVDSFLAYGRYLRPSVALAIGGVNIKPQMRALTPGVEVLVATPGRLMDLMQNRAVALDQVEYFVLDEADRMLDMGFIHDIRRIVGKLPAARQTLFFSATMPKEIAELANAMLRSPVRVAVTPSASTVERVEQRLIHVDRGAKAELLAEVLRAEPIDRVLVFTRTKHGADKVVRALAKSGLEAQAIHGNKSQGQRERVLAAFRTGSVRTLVATDIAARGIDVEGISHVVNYDLPNIPESYVHRIGRTARAGADGIAISFCDAEERPFLRDIEKLIRMSIPATDRRSSRRDAGPAHEADAPRPARPHQQHEQRRGGQNQQRRNGHQGRKANPHRGRDAHPQGQHNGRPARSSKGRRDQLPHSNGSSDGSIASVAFLQHKQRPRPHSGSRTPRQS